MGAEKAGVTDVTVRGATEAESGGGGEDVGWVRGEVLVLQDEQRFSSQQARQPGGQTRQTCRVGSRYYPEEQEVASAVARRRVASSNRIAIIIYNTLLLMSPGTSA